MNNYDKNQGRGGYYIDEMFGENFEAEIMNGMDGSDPSGEGLSKEEKERILKMAANKLEAENKKRTDRIVIQPRMKKRRILTVALIAVLAFATTAFAAELFQWDTRISNYFGIGDKNSASLSGGGMNVGVSDENGGVIIKAVQTIGDGNNMYILFDVTVPEGEIIDPQSGFDMIRLRIGGRADGPTGMGYSCDMIEDDNAEDNKATFLLAMDANKKINHKKIKITFKDLRHYVIGSDDMTVDVPGEWELEWMLNYEDISAKYKIGKELKVKGETVEVDSVSISPIALNVELNGSYIRELDSTPPEPGEEEPIQITAITLKDGSVLTQDDASSWGTSINGTVYVINMQMKKLLDVGQIKSITLNNTEIVL